MKKFLTGDGIVLYSNLDDSYLNLHRKFHRIMHPPKKECIFFSNDDEYLFSIVFTAPLLQLYIHSAHIYPHVHVRAQSCPIDWSPPGSTVHEIFQARILEWVAISFSRGSSQPRVRTHVSCVGRRILYH